MSDLTHRHALDGSAVTTKRAALAAIATALSFPDWFGHNLDALHDSLTDLSWLPAGEHVLTWSGADALRRSDPAAFAAISSVLADAELATADGDRPFRTIFG
ncbi:barstar family protein [Solihabitans fulvus]|uniref:Barstar family protein n=1 Tax=Solihabitans fulvus TaxID=1892852 RepID=A0A5B2XT37_9PSEU|nr:barstar family protein [Solihabitans fulvus]KAA2266090.1 barstar family protein [Solihabitans fulvus]